MKVELEEVYKMIDDYIDQNENNPLVFMYVKEKVNSVLKDLKDDLQDKFPEYVICFGNVNRRFGAALAILSNDTTDLNDVRVLRLTAKQAREKLEKGEIVFSKNEFQEYVNCLNAREKAIVYKSTLGKQSFIDTYLTEEAAEDDK